MDGNSPKVTPICLCQKGDIIILNGSYFVLVNNDWSNNAIFVATMEAYLSVETAASYTYGYTNSGWENVDSTTQLWRVGHISLT